MFLRRAGHSSKSILSAALLLAAMATPGWAVPQASDTMSLLKKAYSQLGSGAVDGAINTLCLAIKNDRNSVMARRYLCFALLQRGDAHAALTQLDALARLNRSISFDMCMRGQALQMMGEFDKAAEAYKAAIGMDPKNDYVRDKLIDALQTSGKYQEASAICADGYYGAADKKRKDHYLIVFNQIQEARAVLHEKSGGAEWTVSGAGAAPPATGETQYGSNASSFAEPQKVSENPPPAK